MSNNKSDLITVTTMTSTANDDELRFSNDGSSHNDIVYKPPPSLHASTKYVCGSPNPQPQVTTSATSTTKASDDRKSAGEPFVQEEDEESATVVEAHGGGDKSIDMNSSNSTGNSGTGTADKHSSCCNWLLADAKRRGDDEDALQLRSHKTTEYSPSARESKVRDNIINSNYYYDHDGGRHRDEIDENDDGFRTPTSLDHKIPAVRPCPPPPRKSTAFVAGDSPAAGSSTSAGSCSKRKSSADGAAPISRRGRSLLDLSKEVESMFPPIVRDNLGRKIKKARSA